MIPDAASAGMLRAVRYPALFCADVAALPLRDGSFDVVLAAHMLYHVPDRRAAVSELRRVLVPAGVCIAVTNGPFAGRHVIDSGTGGYHARMAPSARTSPTV